MSLNIALRHWTGVISLPSPKPPGSTLEIREIFFYVGGSDVANWWPMLFFRIVSSKGNSPFQAVQIGRGISIGGFKTDDKASTGFPKTEIRNLLDDHPSVGT